MKELVKKQTEKIILQRICLFFLCLLFVGLGESRPVFTLPDDILKSAQQQYGEQAKRRLLSWQKLLRGENAALSEVEKLKQVNSFFNQLRFVDDIKHWKKSDYWATPIEFLSSGGGDCEDFSLAKYFTLKALGVDEKKLNMTYVKATKLNQAHMVVTYYPSPGAVPLVLDNLVPAIKPATKRKDLVPVFSFNGTSLWLAKSRGRGEMVGSSARLKRWQNLLSRMPAGLK